ncbi:signal peptidase I [Parasporobacterium paucivorans]|uniref:Signal peptidase I n=1 Tax=Parasporobacterium paucivorans DSM 15970 TaxID=1122934 RepID=A0A1M5ZZZ7_9FIRM|nr:signal peptidase I [Parasporobacterium paucivorans]SHI29805.1 signal peptidase I [Parasporobacterium paucivorans DSM 15970]
MNEPDERSLYQKILMWGTDTVIVIAVALFLLNFYGYQYTVSGSSMVPAVNDGDTLLVDRITHEIFRPDRYDLVIVGVEENGVVQYHIKRIIGLPGETVQIIKGRIYIDGVKLDYNNKQNDIVTPGRAGKEILLGKDEFFVMGDNWNNSEDSRSERFGNVNRNDILGRAWFRSGPTAQIGFIE